MIYTRTTKMHHEVPVIPVETTNKMKSTLVIISVVQPPDGIGGEGGTNLEVDESFDTQKCTEIAKTGGN